VNMMNVDLQSTPGRGLWVTEVETLDLTGGTISGNTATIGGGVLITNSTSGTNTTATLDGVTISGNMATGGTATEGGGIYNDGASLIIQNGSMITGNMATGVLGSGGGLFNNTGGTLMVTGSTISGNMADQDGGGVFNAGGGLDLQNVMLLANTVSMASGSGGGVLSDGGTLSVTGSTVNSNDRLALRIINGSATITGNTFTGNVDADVAVDGTTAAETFVIDPTAVTFAANTVTYDAAVGTLAVFGLDGDDTFRVRPSAATAIDIDGGTPTMMTPGDTLLYLGAGMDMPTGPGAGTITQNGLQDVNYADIENVVVDPPPMPVITAVQGDPTNVSPINFRVDFGEPVMGFVLADLLVTNGTPSNLTTADNQTFTFDVTPTADGLVTVSIPAGVAQDQVGNDNTAATPAVILYDTVPPGVDILGAPTIVNNTTAFQITLKFSEVVTGFMESDIIVGNGSASAFMAVDGATYTAAITPGGTGDVTIDVNAAVALDAAGNPNTAATQVVVTFQTLPPLVTGTIQGTLFVDVNANGVQDAVEPGVAGQRVVLDNNGNGEADPGEPSTLTDASGHFAFNDQALGPVQVLADLPRGSFVFTVPGDGTQTVNLTTANQDVTGVNFGILTVSPAGNPTFPNANLFVPIDASADANTLFVQALYRSLLGREADALGLSYWVSLLPNPLTVDATTYQLARLGVADGLWASFEHRGLQVNAYYLDLLGRLPDPAGASVWFGQLFYGALTEEQVVAGILSSPEYQARFPAGDTAFVDGLFANVLGVTGPTSTTLTFNAQPFDPLAELQAGVSRNQVALDVVYSDQAVLRGIAGDYLAYLQRPTGGGSEQAFWLGIVRGSGRLRDAATGILGSQEFLIRAIAG
jgi:hypothetical protein